jgi:hypothetical protein
MQYIGGRHFTVEQDEIEAGLRHRPPPWMDLHPCLSVGLRSRMLRSSGAIHGSISLRFRKLVPNALIPDS